MNDNCFDLNKVLNERLHDKLMKLIFYILGIILLIYALLGPLQYAEIDSYALPVISLEYRGSLIINQLDINIAQKDFTQFYNGIKEFDDLRSAKLLQLNEESWVSWYFPAYSLICIPFKVMLQVLNLQQERAFSIANVFLYLLALNTVRLKLKMPIKAKFLLFLLLIVNPVTLKYINFCSAEVYIFAFVIISLVFFYNRNYHLAGLYVCIASLSNPAIMAWGIIVFIYFFVSIYTGSSKAIGKVLLENKQKIFQLMICYLICLIPYIFNLCTLGRLTVMSDYAAFNGTLQRFLMYLFDINLGIASCFPLLLVVFGIQILQFRRTLRNEFWTYAIGLLFTLLMISLMSHINSGMMLCSRYIIWTYPILAFAIIVGVVQSEGKRKVGGMVVGSVIVTIILLIVYLTPERVYTEFNKLSELVLNNIPQLYNPFPATFYSRTCHVDGGYDYREHTPVVYLDSQTGEVRKILFCGSEEDKNEIRSLVKADSLSEESIDKKLESISNDGKMHYLNISPNDKMSCKVKNLEELGRLKEVSKVNSAADAVISGEGAVGILSCEVALKANTYYKFNIKIANESVNDVWEEAFVDFYSNEGYDYPEQEQHFKPYVGENVYAFYLNSGDYDFSGEQVYARLVIIADNAIHVESMEIFEMEEIKE